MGGATDGARAVTMLYVADVGRSRDFYRDVVGLEVAMDAGSYAELSWGNLVLGLRRRDNARRQYGDAVAPPDAGASHQVTVTVADVAAVAQRLESHDADVIAPLRDQEWGMRSLTVRDPDGHLVEVGQPID